jgi:glycine C-acetyltransferase
VALPAGIPEAISVTQSTDPAALSGNVLEFLLPSGDDIIGRLDEFYRWQDLRRQQGVWPFGRATEAGPRCHATVHDDSGRRMAGVNFGSQDYLSLSGHPEIKAAARAAIDEYGVHSAGSPALVGNTSVSLALERRIAEFVDAEHVSLFPTGWAAGYGVVKGLVRPDDHVVIDRLAHACLQEGAYAATRNVHLFRHNDIADARAQLYGIRSEDPDHGIMIVTEALFSMNSDTPNIGQLQELASEFRAKLVVDVAHDLGSMGPGGRGHLGLQGMIGKVDLVMGSFSKTFASNGGFVATNHRKVTEYLRYASSPNTFSNALSPLQAAVVLKAFEIVASREGGELRQKMMNNALQLRAQLAAAGFGVYGEPSPIVCVEIGSDGLARLVSRQFHQKGLVANLVEYPAVPRGQARFRLQVMANHSEKDIACAVDRVAEGYRQACIELKKLQSA